MSEPTEPVDESFWEIAGPFMANGAERSTMMGFPCLRTEGAFFASVDHRTGELIVKLPAERVIELIEAGTAEEFAPAGRRFREWALIPHDHELLWEDLMTEAEAFVCSK